MIRFAPQRSTLHEAVTVATSFFEKKMGYISFRLSEEEAWKLAQAAEHYLQPHGFSRREVVLLAGCPRGTSFQPRWHHQ